MQSAGGLEYVVDFLSFKSHPVLTSDAGATPIGWSAGYARYTYILYHDIKWNRYSAMTIEHATERLPM